MSRLPDDTLESPGLPADGSPGARLRDPLTAVAREPVRLVGVSKVYPGESDQAVQDVELRIEPGEFFSLLGPSGSGKTTTLRMIAGFEKPTTGAVWLGDEEITSRPPYRRPINTVFQNYALFPHMTVRQNIAYPLKMAKTAKAEIRSRVDEFLQRVAITELADRMPHQLSGGQRQRAALARALVGKPQVVLLDEPLGALDLKLRQEMQVMLQHLQREVGITFVYVTHDQGEALAMSDQIAIMADGRVHQVGSPEEVYSQPATTFVARFVGSTSLLECHRSGDRILAGDLEVEVENAPAAPRFYLSVRPEVLRLGPDSDGCDNTAKGMIEESIYQGSEVQLRVRVDGHLLRARGRVGVFQPGDVIDIGWNTGDAFAIPASDAGERSSIAGT